METNNKDIKAAINIINGKYRLVDRSKYRPIYPWTNERIDKYVDTDLDNKHILTVTSSFDHALYAIYNGATNIDCFDINRLCKYYADLKRALILAYDEETVKKILNFKIDNYNFRSYRMNTHFSIDDLKDYFILPESFSFWSTILENKMFKYNNHRLFRRDGNPHYNLPQFSEVKRKLQGAEINFVDLDIKNIDQKFDQYYKYDVIFLSNVLDFIPDEDIFYSVLNHLNNNGILYDYHIAGYDRTYGIEPIKTIVCSDSGKQVCKIYQKKYQTKN